MEALAASTQGSADTHRLSLAAQPEALETLGAWLAQLKDACGLSADLAYRLELVLTEAVTNVIEHGAAAAERGDGPAPAKSIVLACVCEAGVLKAEIEDDGPAFDPTARPEISLPDSLEHATPGGLGVFLVRHYTTAMDYRRERGRNVLSLAFAKEAAARPGSSTEQPA
jgi:Anti-sigma regulatory factor (Ser/Thr protein kinase)